MIDARERPYAELAVSRDMIGYYVHHHGSGHLQRARSIAAQLCMPVTGLSSLPRPADWPGEWIELDSDLAEQASEPSAEGALHWAPLHHSGLRARMARIAAWIGQADPAVLVCDVSVEVAALARLMGVPVLSVALPGVREDAPHELGYRLSSAIVALWPPERVPVEWPARWHGKTHPVGALSRFDARERVPEREGAAERERVPERGQALAPEQAPRASGAGRRAVTVLLGAGGDRITAGDLDAAAAATPGWSWRVLGPGRWTDDPWLELCRAEVVVTHAGQNCIGEVAAARRPAIVIPQSRPHDEQLSTARALERERLAIVSYSWPRPGAWPGLLDAARALGGERWASWSSGEGARRVARVVEGVATRAAAIA